MYKFFLFFILFLAASDLYAIVPPWGSSCLRLLVLSDLTEVGLPPGSHEYLFQVLNQRHLVRPLEIEVRNKT